MHTLLLLRHGEAEQGWPDRSRELTAHGRQEVKQSLSSFYQHLNGEVRVWHSGLTRAEQSAQIVCEEWASHCSKVPQGQLQHLNPEADVLSAIKEVEALLGDSNGSQVLLATHNSFVERFIEYLTDQSVRVRTGQLVALECEVLARGCANILA